VWKLREREKKTDSRVVGKANSERGKEMCSPGNKEGGFTWK
jgi:hypothetical protein